MTRKIIISTFILIVLFSSIIYAQETQLDPRRFEAWTVEYEPYRLLIENAVIEYISLSKDKIPPINPGDILIAVRSKSRKGELYQIRYGAHAEGFTIVEGKKVQWILGSTTVSTIAEKDKYYHLDSRIPFQLGESKPELDYLNTELFWTNADLLLGLDRSVYRFGSSGGILFEWGNELMGLPYADAGTMRLGIATSVFKLGLQAPSLINVGLRPGADETERLNGGIGAFGAFNYSNLYGELTFLTNTADGISMDPSVSKTSEDYISYMDISGLTYFCFGAPFSKLKGAFQIKPGFVVYRIAHRKIDKSSGEKKLVNRTVNRSDESIDPNKFDGGFFLRVDYASGMLGENLFPKFLFTLQLNSATSFLTKFTLNLNDSISIPVTVAYYLADNDYTPNIVTHFGIQFRLRTFGM